jgi:uncharacterized protein YndB with AHSA1/START domain
MSKQRSVLHHTFTVERSYPQSPTSVYLAYAQQDRRKCWFVFPDETWRVQETQFNFYPNLRDTYVAHPPAELEGAPVVTYETYYYEIGYERMTYAYEMRRGDERVSVSLVTIELHLDGEGTRLVYTEQGVLLDERETPEMRASFVGALLDRLGAWLASSTNSQTNPMKTNLSVVRHGFAVERTFSQTPSKVYSAFAKKNVKEQWFTVPDDRWDRDYTRLELHEQGTEIFSAHPPGKEGDQGAEMVLYCAYFFEVRKDRIIYSYEVRGVSASIVTIELRKEGRGTRLVWREQGAYFEGRESPELRETMTHAVLDKLGTTLSSLHPV